MSANSSWPDASLIHCRISPASLTLSTAVQAVRAALLLPLCSRVLMLARRHHPPRAPASHSDLFAFHLSAMELLWVCGVLLFWAGLYGGRPAPLTAGLTLALNAYYGEMLFHGLTCAERHLAVVRPVAYRALRGARGARPRNAAAGAVWLLSLAAANLQRELDFPASAVVTFVVLGLLLGVTSFCSASVLLVLRRGGVSGAGRAERAGRGRRRALITVTAIWAAVWLWFCALLATTALDYSPAVDERLACVLAAATGFLNLPSALVSPLLCLHRNGRLGGRGGAQRPTTT